MQEGRFLAFGVWEKGKCLLWGHSSSWIVLQLPEVSLGWDRVECVQGKQEASATPAIQTIFGRSTLVLALEPGAVFLKVGSLWNSRLLVMRRLCVDLFVRDYTGTNLSSPPGLMPLLQCGFSCIDQFSLSTLWKKMHEISFSFQLNIRNIMMQVSCHVNTCQNNKLVTTPLQPLTKTWIKIMNWSVLGTGTFKECFWCSGWEFKCKINGKQEKGSHGAAGLWVVNAGPWQIVGGHEWLGR